MPLQLDKIMNNSRQNFSGSILKDKIAGFDRNRTQTAATGLDNAEFNNIRDFIYKHCGIYFTDGKKYLLEGRIKKRMDDYSFRSFIEYFNFIKSFDGQNEFNALIDAITINETYFFRAEQQLNLLEQELVDRIVQSRNGTGNVINIWSAASSTGEEAYSIAMLINEKIKPKYPNVIFKIVGSDINRDVIDSARQGIYKDYAVKQLPNLYLKKYFTLKDGKFFLSDDIKKMVKFIRLNLFDERAVKTMVYFDIIYCANVLIYFDNQSKERVVSSLYDSLNKGGYLFIGSSESLHGVSKAFRLVNFHGAMGYVKD